MSPIRFSENMVMRLALFAIVGLILWKWIESKGDAAKSAAGAAAVVASAMPVI